MAKVHLAAPDFAVMDDRTFAAAMMEFVGMCDARHPHWHLWADEQSRRAAAQRETHKARLQHLTPAYVELVSQAA